MARRIFRTLILFLIAGSLLVVLGLALLDNFLAPAIEKKIRQVAAENFDKRIELAQVNVKLPEAVVHIKGFGLTGCNLGRYCVSVNAGEAILRISLISTFLQKKLIFDEVYLKDWVFLLGRVNPSTPVPANAGAASSSPTAPEPIRKLFSEIYVRTVKADNLKFIYEDYTANKPPTKIELVNINGFIDNLSASMERPGDFKGVVNFRGYLESPDKGALTVEGAVSSTGEKINFKLRSELKDADITYFAPYYTNTSFTILKAARIDIVSNAHCRANELQSSHNAHIYEIKLNNVTPRPDDTLFTLPATTVINFFNDYGGEVRFSFNIGGTLNDPKFEPGPLIQQVLSKALGDRIAARLKELPREVAKMSERAVKGDLDIGKESQIWFKEIEKKFELFKNDLKEKYDASKHAQ